MIDLTAAIVSGLAATFIFDIWAMLARATGLTTMRVENALGSIFTEGKRMVFTGMLIHFAFGMGIALIYAAIFEQTGAVNGPLTGGIIGLLHGLIIGLIVLPMMGTLHPAMRAGRVEIPGFFAINKGSASPLYIMIGHLIFGSVIGAVYFMI